MASKKKNKKVITPMDLVTIEKRKQRQEMLDQGAQTLRASRVHKTQKDYSRKQKHKGKGKGWE